VVDAFARIVKDEGVMGLWRGATPTVIRAMVLNLAMLATYDEAKELMLHTFKLYESETLELRIM
jgi:solute carrier family 25 oxoglutarate transporter 11